MHMNNFWIQLILPYSHIGRNHILLDWSVRSIFRTTQETFLNAYDLAAYCSENEGPFTYLNKWVAAFDAVYRLIYRFFEIDLEFNILFVGGLFGGEQDEIPLLYQAIPWLSQFQIASVLSVIDNQISLAALLIDPIIQTPLYNLLRFPVCDRF